MCTTDVQLWTVCGHHAATTFKKCFRGRVANRECATAANHVELSTGWCDACMEALRRRFRFDGLGAGCSVPGRKAFEQVWAYMSAHGWDGPVSPDDIPLDVLRGSGLEHRGCVGETALRAEEHFLVRTVKALQAASVRFESYRLPLDDDFEFLPEMVHTARVRGSHSRPPQGEDPFVFDDFPVRYTRFLLKCGLGLDHALLVVLSKGPRKTPPRSEPEAPLLFRWSGRPEPLLRVAAVVEMLRAGRAPWFKTDPFDEVGSAVRFLRDECGQQVPRLANAEKLGGGDLMLAPNAATRLLMWNYRPGLFTDEEVSDGDEYETPVVCVERDARWPRRRLRPLDAHVPGDESSPLTILEHDGPGDPEVEGALSRRELLEFSRRKWPSREPGTGLKRPKGVELKPGSRPHLASVGVPFKDLGTSVLGR